MKSLFNAPAPTIQISYNDVLPVYNSGKKLAPSGARPPALESNSSARDERNSLPAPEGATRRAAGWEPSGKRILRGLYKTSLGFLINADLNGAANILKKVSIQLGFSLAEVCKGALTLPKRYDVFKHMKKSYRKRSEEAQSRS